LKRLRKAENVVAKKNKATLSEVNNSYKGGLEQQDEQDQLSPTTMLLERQSSSSSSSSSKGKTLS
jgi:hypothetical protein